jgi:transcriptional regulator of acetoin/glycerol metabolism
VEDLPLNLEAAEQALIERALAACKGNVAQAARLLGVPRMRIYRRMGARRDDAS